MTKFEQLVFMGVAIFMIAFTVGTILSTIAGATS